MLDIVKERLKHLPEDSGVYMMKNQSGDIIYVGKAKSLRKRVRSYFVGLLSKDLKTQVLVREITDIDIILTKSEPEALLLERTLIRHHAPRYNVMLKDGKEYPYIRVNFKDDWPRIEKVRQRKDDGAFYLGPFSKAGYLTTALKLMGRVFPLIRCSRHEFNAAKRPCNYYHMKMCLGPCTLPIDRNEYVAMINDALAFLMGKNKDLAKQLEAKMHAAAGREQFELAAQYRDQLFALQEINKRQTAVVKNIDDADVIALRSQGKSTAVHILMVREGRIIGGDNFVVPSPIQTPDEVLSAFLLQYYDSRLVPKELIVPFELEGFDELLHVLGPPDMPKPSYKTKLIVPQRAERHDLLQMAQKNADFQLDEATREAGQKKVELELLAEFLQLPSVPQRMECIDISNLQGQAVVASNVCFMDGKPAKQFYRHYKISSLEEGEQNDFASITEVVHRRLLRGERDDDLPDLLIIDGGKGQLNAAMKAKQAFPQLKLTIISLAKARVDREHPDKHGAPRRSYERVFLPAEENASPLKPGSAPYRILTHIRDEAHRFAISHHRRQRAKSFSGSILDDVPGIGAVLRKRLLEFFGGIDGIKSASLDELLKVPGMKESTAVALHARFRE
jgi:excinuclease ABC subunit C